jgi:Cft2 family RNA processing exonuclease
MNIRKLLSNLFSFVTDLRRSGTTTLIQKVASENDVWVLVPNQQIKVDMKNKIENKHNSKQLNILAVRSSKINRLKEIKEASVTDLVGGENLVWLMKKIIIEQNERIEQLELKVAELRGEVEED